MMRCGLLASGLALAALCSAPAKAAAENASGPLACQWMQAADVDPELAPDPAAWSASSSRHRLLPFVHELMRRPLNAPCRASDLLDDARRIESPVALLRWAAALSGVDAPPLHPVSTPTAPAPTATDPLADSLAWMAPMALAAGMAWPPPLPDEGALPAPLRTEIARLLAAIGRAYRLLDRALARLPPELTPQALHAQVRGTAAGVEKADDVRLLLPLLDRQMLAAGMLEVAAASEKLARFVIGASTVPSLSWQIETPRGAVVIDTTRRDNKHQLSAPLLVLDVGGDDEYHFDSTPPARHIAVLIDHDGNDRYVAHADGADPSAATLGFGLLWDSEGDDAYEASHFAQGAALFGAALLVDSAGRNRFTAAGHAQAWALGGVALLAAGAGSDEYHAQTHAQASGGPEGIAVLIDRGGDDRYTLAGTPLIRPSPQLSTHNTSMGQGAGRGLRPLGDDALAATGGIGLLIDLDGDDRYTAQVFAQGAGYYEGAGLLIDGGGADRFDATWYAMGAAAHSAAGVLLKRGGGDDRYRATHVTSLGAAHDASVGAFFDEGGNDRYALGDLGFGASHEGGVALFFDGGGSDRYELSATRCRAFGFKQSVDDSDMKPAGGNELGVYISLDPVNDRLPLACIRRSSHLHEVHRASDDGSRRSTL